MTSLIVAEPKELMPEHLTSLRSYARRVLIQGETLTAIEEEDKERRLREYLAVGSSVKLTEREMAALVYKGFFMAKRGCGCPTCRTRDSLTLPLSTTP